MPTFVACPLCKHLDDMIANMHDAGGATSMYIKDEDLIPSSGTYRLYTDSGTSRLSCRLSYPRAGDSVVVINTTGQRLDVGDEAGWRLTKIDDEMYSAFHCKENGEWQLSSSGCFY